jgi:hypothetical protein
MKFTSFRTALCDWEPESKELLDEDELKEKIVIVFTYTCACNDCSSPIQLKQGK